MLCLPYPVLSPVVFSFKYQQLSVGILTNKIMDLTPGNHICWKQDSNDQFHLFHTFTTISMRIISLISLAYTCDTKVISYLQLHKLKF